MEYFYSPFHFLNYSRITHNFRFTNKRFNLVNGLYVVPSCKGCPELLSASQEIQRWRFQSKLCDLCEDERTFLRVERAEGVKIDDSFVKNYKYLKILRCF